MLPVFSPKFRPLIIESPCRVRILQRGSTRDLISWKKDRFVSQKWFLEVTDELVADPIVSWRFTNYKRYGSTLKMNCKTWKNGLSFKKTRQLGTRTLQSQGTKKHLVHFSVTGKKLLQGQRQLPRKMSFRGSRKLQRSDGQPRPLQISQEVHLDVDRDDYVENEQQERRSVELISDSCHFPHIDSQSVATFYTISPPFITNDSVVLQLLNG